MLGRRPSVSAFAGFVSVPFAKGTTSLRPKSVQMD